MNSIKISWVHIIAVLLLVSTGSNGTTITIPNDRSPTITAALATVKKGDTIRVEAGIYKEHIFINPGVALLSQEPLKAVIDGSGRGTTVTMGSGSTISGFEIRNGTIGVFSTASGAHILQCRIDFNQQTGIMCVGNLPNIQDNIISFNKGSGIQGWDVRSTSASISHNTIGFNSNHGVAVGGNSSIILENNIIAFNDQFGIKPSEESVHMDLINNCFFQNTKFTSVLPDENFALDPVFVDPAHGNFALGKDSQCIGRGSDNQNLGARLVY